VQMQEVTGLPSRTIPSFFHLGDVDRVGFFSIWRYRLARTGGSRGICAP
jgi:hypothetical protein